MLLLHDVNITETHMEYILGAHKRKFGFLDMFFDFNKVIRNKLINNWSILKLIKLILNAFKLPKMHFKNHFTIKCNLNAFKLPKMHFKIHFKSRNLNFENVRAQTKEPVIIEEG